jgi:hypothetical protein
MTYLVPTQAKPPRIAPKPNVSTPTLHKFYQKETKIRNETANKKTKKQKNRSRKMVTCCK